ncbi:class F sortase [Streptomyces sp. DK15]|uniref:class F sortase n=2 Tax=unclassified Streptomyces TaxID=2593676 RepID=UPI0029BA2342|nr:class F sortase [Streptomyces sp. DK15]MDX2396285.1 class F sortase [Streptomyces sp. DK15]
MAERTPSHPGGRRTRRAAARAGARPLAPALVPALVLLLGAAAAGCSGGAGAARAATTPAATAVSVLPPSVPDRIEIPDIKVDAPLDTVGLDAQGVMREPDFAEPDDAAWYEQGPTPGERGASAIVGHMDTPRAPKAVFFNLKELKKDQRIEVHRTDGTTAVFAVDEVDTFKKDAFPTDRVYGDTRGRAELRLITCGGDLTADRHWDANVVVFAHLTGKA